MTFVSRLFRRYHPILFIGSVTNNTTTISAWTANTNISTRFGVNRCSSGLNGLLGSKRFAVGVTSFLFAMSSSSMSMSQKSRVTALRAESSSDSASVCRDYDVGVLNAKDAYNLDVELMESPGFTLEQLMELAGLSVAEAVYEVVQPSSVDDGKDVRKKRILLVCGPGNNGGDGLVAARHLFHFGYDCVVVYPKRPNKKHFIDLVKQCEDLGIKILDDMPIDLKEFDTIVDAVFGFSFKGEPREPFKTILSEMFSSMIPVISVDVPSGWNVDEGDINETGYMPEVLISLTTPKKCSKMFNGRHFIGGRFLPPKLASKYGIKMPPYKGVSQVMEMTSFSGTRSNEKPISNCSSTDWQKEYAEYLATKEEPLEANVKAVQEKIGEEDWAIQYDQYLQEKYEAEQNENGSNKS
mmetsp:Transcript_9286/g.11994  ORF Transcript_9286/g.11994 Transcript_9286/m.11994 type:complete len:410 (-) Transcript_9286:371-1600(-)